jgi:hypothetical protein
VVETGQARLQELLPLYVEAGGPKLLRRQLTNLL